MSDFPIEIDDPAAAAALAGDAAAFGTVTTAYKRRVFAFLGRMGFDRAATSTKQARIQCSIVVNLFKGRHLASRQILLVILAQVGMFQPLVEYCPERDTPTLITS